MTIQQITSKQESPAVSVTRRSEGSWKTLQKASQPLEENGLNLEGWGKFGQVNKK